MILKMEQRSKVAAGFAVFPNIVKAGLGFGGARGSGEVFEDGKIIGSTTVTQLSLSLIHISEPTRPS